MIAKKTKPIIFTLLFIFIMLTTLFLVGCDDNIITNVTSLNGIVDRIEISSTSDDNINSISIVFLDNPSSLDAVYGEDNIEGSYLEIEDYYNDGSNVNAYSYTFTIGEITIEDYNQSPIIISCTVDENNYRFNLTTDLISLIYPDLVDDINN